MNDKIYQPKGGMCSVCKYRDSNCSKLPFSEYPEISSYMDDTYPIEIVIVKCLQYIKGEP